MNIKNIIKEEMDDFDWIRDLESSYSVRDMIDSFNSLQDIPFSTVGKYYPTDEDGNEKDLFGRDFNYDKVMLMNVNEAYGRGSLLTIKIMDEKFGRGHNGRASGEGPVVGCNEDCYNMTEHNVSITFVPITNHDEH